ncbi:hypothetical protein K438DRAFT_1973402 [Mycena galopus ATCC 62051]|nr:hypothetical protein K438DRAFT_1973402 [Mycena galopus ATCC 62051]
MVSSAASSAPSRLLFDGIQQLCVLFIASPVLLHYCDPVLDTLFCLVTGLVLVSPRVCCSLAMWCSLLRGTSGIIVRSQALPRATFSWHFILRCTTCFLGIVLFSVAWMALHTPSPLASRSARYLLHHTLHPVLCAPSVASYLLSRALRALSHHAHRFALVLCAHCRITLVVRALRASRTTSLASPSCSARIVASRSSFVLYALVASRLASPPCSARIFASRSPLVSCAPSHRLHRIAVEERVGRWVDQSGLGRAGRGEEAEEEKSDDPGIRIWVCVE